MPTRSARPRALMLLTAAALGVCAPPADADDGSWTAAPRTSGRDDGARTRFYLEGGPGAVLTDTLSVVNEGRSGRTYALSGHRDAGGRWIVPAEDSVRVPGRTRADIPLAVRVPPDAPPGNHPGAVVVSDGKRKVDVPVQVRVTGRTLAALSVENTRVRTTDDGTDVGYVLVNRGNTALTPRTAVSGDGSYLPPRKLPGRLLPGERITLHERWPDAPVLGSGSVTVRVTAGGGAGDEGTVTHRATPWPAVVALAASLTAGAGGGRYRLRFPARPEGPAPDRAETAAAVPPRTDRHTGHTELTATGAAK